MKGHKSRPSCTSWLSLPAESYEYLISFSTLSAPLCMLHANLLHSGDVNPRWQTFLVCVGRHERNWLGETDCRGLVLCRNCAKLSV
jgi:hypothetical protein